MTLSTQCEGLILRTAEHLLLVKDFKDQTPWGN